MNVGERDSQKRCVSSPLSKVANKRKKSVAGNPRLNYPGRRLNRSKDLGFDSVARVICYDLGLLSQTSPARTASAVAAVLPDLMI